MGQIITLQDTRPVFGKPGSSALATLRYGVDPVAYGRAINPARFYDVWQADLVRDLARYILIVAARQIGKSSTIADKIAHGAEYTNDSLWIIAAAVGRQAAEIFFKIQRNLEKSPRRPKLKRASTKELWLENGSRVICVPGEPENVAGFSAPNGVVIDEAAYAKDGLLSVLSPMLAMSNGQLILISTPFLKEGFFYDIYAAERARQSRGHPQQWKIYEIPATQCERYNPVFLNAERQRLGDWWFNSQYMCKFQDRQATVFSGDWLDRAFAGEQITPMFDEKKQTFVHHREQDVKPLFEDNFRLRRKAG